jgi:hypothetical protein
LDPKYVDVVVRRWQDLAGKKATLGGAGRTFDDLAHERCPAQWAYPQAPDSPEGEMR